MTAFDEEIHHCDATRSNSQRSQKVAGRGESVISKNSSQNRMQVIVFVDYFKLQTTVIQRN